MSKTEKMLSYKALEIIMSASLTINLCVMFYVILPSSLKLFKKYKELNSSLQTNVPALINRLSSSLPFYVAFPVCSLILLFTSNVLNNPFFAFDHSLRIVFSAALGQYIYKCAESLYWYKKSNYKPVLIHHSVVIAINVVVLWSEQCAVMGLVGLLLKGSFAFAEFDYGKLSKVQKPSDTLMVVSTVVFMVAIVLKGVVPGLLILYSVASSSNELLKMHYVPLAFFFLALVFFSAVSGWFIKDAFYTIKSLMHCRRHKEMKLQFPKTVVNNQGLVQLLETAQGAANIKCNALWDKDLKSLRGSHTLQSKVMNSDVVEIECETPSVIKMTNITSSDQEN